MHLEVARSFAGPPNMGHGGYVAGRIAAHLLGDRPATPTPAVEVTLRRPVPLNTPMDLDDAGTLRHGEELIAEARILGDDEALELDVPAPPDVATAKAAEAGSPALAAEYNEGRGVHPICFGCGNQRPDDDGLQIFVGPVDGADPAQVAAVWRPSAERTDTTHVLAALDCPGAFAFIATGDRAGLLGRIVFRQLADVRPDSDHVVTGWRIGVDGRKMFAGTALSSADGEVLAVAKATWFGRPGV
jgi:hypothetical protein